MKQIETLITDIYEVVRGKGGWDKTISSWVAHQIATTANNRFSFKQEPRSNLSPSMLGTICDIELWNKINRPGTGEPLSAETLGTFFYGDVLEQIVIGLAIAAGHKVECIQEPVDIYGMPGTSDVVIDGYVIDVKSASSMSFEKFERNQLKGYNKYTKGKEEPDWVPQSKADAFGYISQLSSYLAGYKDDDRVIHKNTAGFLVVRKDRFKLTLDMYDLTEEVANKEAEVERGRSIINGPKPTERLPDVEDGKSGNRKLDTKCSYCSFKKDCWPELRTFIYSSGPRFLTHVEREPDVPEV